MIAQRFEQLALPVRRVVAAGLLAVAALVVVFWIVVPSFRWAHSAAESLDEARFELGRVVASAGADSALSAAQVDAMHQEVSAWLTPGAQAGDAAASFQASAGAVLATHGMVVESMVGKPPIGAGAVQQLVLDWRGTGSEASMVRALVAIESARPLLRVEKLHVQKAQVTDQSAKAAGGVQLLVEMRLVAYWAAPAASVAPAPKRGLQK